MYNVVYSILYVFSLLPWRVLYFLGDIIYIFFYYVFGYRKKVVMGNLQIAFPEKDEKQRIQIAKQFYHNFIDSFIEIIKLISITEKEFRKRVSGNIEVINNLYDTDVPNVAIVSAHFFNWEFANLANSLESKFQLLGVYMPVQNKIFDKLMLNMRKKFGAILIPLSDFRRQFIKYARTKFGLGLIADQSTISPENAYWFPFFGKLTPFFKRS